MQKQTQMLQLLVEYLEVTHTLKPVPDEVLAFPNAVNYSYAFMVALNYKSIQILFVYLMTKTQDSQM